jgi:hypothetical protein
LVAADFTGDGKPDLLDLVDLSSGEYNIGLNTSTKTESSFAVTGPSSVTSGQPFTIAVTAQNADGSTNVGYSGTVNFNSSDGQQVTPSSGQFSAANQGVQQFTVTLVTAGRQTLDFQDSNNPAMSGTFDLTVNPGAVNGRNSTITLANPTDASGTTDQATIVVEDAAGNTISGLTSQEFAFSFTGGTSTGSMGSVTPTNVPGTYVSTFTGVVAGSPEKLLLKVQGVPITTQPKVQVTPGVVSATQSTVSLAQSTLASGRSTTVTLRIKDAAGNLISDLPGSDFVLNLTGGSSTGSFGTVIQAREPGTYVMTLTGIAAGTSSATSVTVNGVSLDAQPSVTVKAGSVNPITSSVNIASLPALSGVPDLVTITVKDTAGNPIRGLLSKAFSLYFFGGKSTGKFTKVTPTTTPGNYSTTFTGEIAGSASTLLVEVDGLHLATKPTIQVVPGKVSASSKFQFATALTKKGKNDVVTVIVGDNAGNLITGLVSGDFVFDFTEGTSSGSFGTVTETNTHGVYEVIFTGTQVGNATTVSLTIDGVLLTQKPKIRVMA